MFKTKKIFLNATEVTHEELLLDFKKRYLETKGFVRSSIYWMINSNDVDDLVQEVFLKGWRNYKSFENRSSFKTWIYRISMNVVYDFLKRNKVVVQEISDEDIFIIDNNLEMSDIISKGFMILPVEQREAFMLHYQLEHTYCEIAKLLTIPEGTVKSRVSAGKKTFISFLKKNGVSYG